MEQTERHFKENDPGFRKTRNPSYGMSLRGETRVAANSKVFIEPAENGMHTTLAGALKKKKVPVTVVMTADKADYVITVVGEYRKAGRAKTIMSGGGARARPMRA